MPDSWTTGCRPLGYVVRGGVPLEWQVSDASAGLPATLPRMLSRPRASLGVLPDDLYIEPEPWPRIGRPPKDDVGAWTVTDDWPDPVPIIDAELDVVFPASCAGQMNKRHQLVGSDAVKTRRNILVPVTRTRALFCGWLTYEFQHLCIHSEQ